MSRLQLPSASSPQRRLAALLTLLSLLLLASAVAADLETADAATGPRKSATTTKGKLKKARACVPRAAKATRAKRRRTRVRACASAKAVRADLYATPTSLSFTATQGAAVPATKPVYVKNRTSGGNTAYVESNDADWLTVSPSIGNAPATLTASITTTNLPVGTHRATITIDPAEANDANIAIPVTLTVAAAAATPAPTATPAPSATPAPTATPTPAPVSSPSGLTATALDAGAARLSWPARSAARVQILRDGRLIDEIAGAGTTYVDRLLWSSTTYAYEVRFRDAAGTTTGTLTTSVTTPARTSVTRLYADTAFVNQKIPANPALDSNSSAIVQKSLAAYKTNANVSNSDWWGVNLAYADAASPSYTVGCTLYWCDVPFAPQRIPAYAQPTLGSDHHLAVIDGSTGAEMDMWVAEKTAGGWQAGTRWATRADGSGVTCTPGQNPCGGAIAANFALAAGIVRPEELAVGRIDHALVITSPYTRSGFKACPATHTDGRNADAAAIPLGARVQLDPSIDVNALAIPAWKKVIARALQEYGAYVADTGGSVSIRAESTMLRGYDAWAKVGVSSGGPLVNDLPWDRMRVLSMTAC